jgi:Domain of unknown function (DUF4157)
MTKHSQMLLTHSHAVPRKRTDEADAAFHQAQPLDPRAIIRRAALAPASLRPADILRSQQTIGNRAVARLLSQLSPARSLVQAKPTANASGDEYKQEADRVAEGVMTTPGPTQLRTEALPRSNDTGLPDSLKSGIETLSGLSMDNVNVHYNSPQPARLNALAYTQGRDIHVAPGQERHLPHEAWHVVQQHQGRVGPTLQLNGAQVNDDQGLEREAAVMGRQAFQRRGPEQPGTGLAVAAMLAGQGQRALMGAPQLKAALHNPSVGGGSRGAVIQRMKMTIKTKEGYLELDTEKPEEQEMIQNYLAKFTLDKAWTIFLKIGYARSEKRLEPGAQKIFLGLAERQDVSPLPSSSSMSALSSAIEQRNAYWAMESINQGEKLDAEDDNGDTALHRVIKTLQDSSESIAPDPNFIDLAKLLIAKKPDLLNKRNNKEKTPLDLILRKSAGYELTLGKIDSLVADTDLTKDQLRNIRKQINDQKPTDDKSLADTVKSAVINISDNDLKLITEAAKSEPKPTKGERKVITYVWRNVSSERENIRPSLSTKLKEAIAASEEHEKFKESLRKQQNAPKQPIKLIDIWGKHIFYVNDPSNQGESAEIENSVSKIKTRLQELYEQAETLRPVMDVATYAMRGDHDRSFSKQKELSIYIIKPEALASKSTLDPGGGVYPFENGIFIDYGLLKEPNKIVGVILHEITHFVVNEVFKNKALPYFSHQIVGRQYYNESQDYKEMMAKTVERNKAAESIDKDKDDQTAHEIIKNVFTAYAGYQQEQELIVRVSEIIGTLGPEKGASWLGKNYPELYTYFDKKFRPTVEKYLHSQGSPEKTWGSHG